MLAYRMLILSYAAPMICCNTMLQAGAMYATDLMLDWVEGEDGQRTVQPKVRVLLDILVTITWPPLGAGV